jgi:hypothetical protein
MRHKGRNKTFRSYFNRTQTTTPLNPHRKSTESLSEAPCSQSFAIIGMIYVLSILLVLVTTRLKPKRRGFRSSVRLRLSFALVTVGCREPPGTYNPPIGEYNIIEVHCRNEINDIDGREVGPMLRFLADTYGKLNFRKIVFAHAHDKGNHLPGGKTLWYFLNRYQNSEYFRTRRLGQIIPVFRLTTEFRRINGYIYSEIQYAKKPWLNMTDLVQFFFQNTSFMNMKLDRWDTPCCATFFLDTKLILDHPREDYLKILERVNQFVPLGYCRLFGESRCREEPAAFKLSQKDWNYIAAEVMERSWIAMFSLTSGERFEMLPSA